MKRRVIRAKVSTHDVVSVALNYAIERGMNRCDKYHEEPLTEAQRGLLLREVDSSFWLALDDAGVELR